MINELLFYGKDNARPGKDLAKQLGVDIRNITEQVERERREGQPICANMSGTNAGYYLAENAEELQDYCGRLKHRAIEMLTTKSKLDKILKNGYTGHQEQTKEDAAESIIS